MKVLIKQNPLLCLRSYFSIHNCCHITIARTLFQWHTSDNVSQWWIPVL